MAKSYYSKMGILMSNTAKKIIRCKKDVIILIIEATKYLTYSDKIDFSHCTDELVVKIDKMNRLFFKIENKIFSVNFPFCIELNESCDQIQRFYYNEFTIDNRILSQLSEIFDQVTNEFSFEETLDIIFQNEDLYENLKNLWAIIKLLYTNECGYLRYDYDPNPERLREGIHPLHHLDINYSTPNTYKIGLQNNLSLEDFIDVVDTTTNCYILRAC